MHLDVEHPPFARDHRRVEERGESLDVGGGRHRQQPEVGADRRRHIECECEAEVGGEVAFVYLVEDHQTHAGELGIVLEAAGEHAFGDHLDAGGVADVALVSSLVADEAADIRSRGVGHPASRGASGETTGFEHHDAPAVEPHLVEQRERDHRGLAGAGRGDENSASMVGESRTDFGDRLDDGKIRQ